MSNQSLYGSANPYYSTNIVNNLFLDVMVERPIPKYATDVYMTITAPYQYRPDLLAQDLYNNSQLWWVFAARNPNILGSDPLFNFVAGTGIYIPTQETLNSALGL